MKIEKMRLRDLQKAEYNPRRMSEEMKEKLKKSIEEFGYVEPIVWNARTGRIVGGHQRYDALMDLYGEDYEVEVVVVDLSEDDEKVLNIALNAIRGDWDMSKLRQVFEELSIDEIEDLGFDEAEVEKILKRIEKEAKAPAKKHKLEIVFDDEFDYNEVKSVLVAWSEVYGSYADALYAMLLKLERDGDE